MKKNKYIFFMSFLLFIACNNFLEETPETSIAKKSVYNSLSTAKAALAGCYATLSAYNAYGFNYFHLLNASSGVGVSLKANDVNLASLNILPTNINVGNAYKGLYTTIASANDIISGMESSNITNEFEAKRIKGEARIIRAISYFNLVRLFGKVSLITSPVTSYQEAQHGRDEVSLVYTAIVKDLKEAADLLPQPSDKIEGHPHSFAAQALLAKVYLTMAGNDENSEYWQLAYNTAKVVYDSQSYNLVYPYEHLFGSDHNNNLESIFEIQFSATVTGGRITETTFPIGHSLMSNILSKGKSWGKTRPSQLIFDQFDQEDPRREASFVYGQYLNIFENKANKKNVALYPTKKGESKENGLFYKKGESDYPAWKKYYDTQMTASTTNCNFVYYRYADLLLVLAEAANEIGNANAADYLNEVLDRARDKNGNRTIEVDEIYPLPVNAIERGDKILLRKRILKERLKELTGECDEWYTIRRRGFDYLRQAMEGHNMQIQTWYSAQDIPISTLKGVYIYDTSDEAVRRNLLLPFPQDEINRNENISQEEQNYGY